jgi:putative transposase
MKQFNKLAHAVWQCKYRIVWCPKYRFRILKDEIGKLIRDIIRQLCEWRRIDILEGNVQVDHIRHYVRWQQHKDRKLDQTKLWQ